MATLRPFCGIVNDLLSSATRRAVFGSAVSRPDFLMKTPRDLADTIKGRNSGQLIRQTLRLPRAEARKRAKQLFDEFPSATYLTEIESWQEARGSGQVEFTFKRLENPIDPD
jgi:hypothetical protein